LQQPFLNKFTGGLPGYDLGRLEALDLMAIDVELGV
jgi:hypothetical protein